MNICTKVVALAAVAIVLSQSGVAMAKGGTPAPVSSTVPTVAGPCVDITAEDYSFLSYPLTNDKYPGTVAPYMDLRTLGVIKLVNVCLEPGWTVVDQSSSTGVQLRFFYNGIKAIDFKFVPGKTDIRNY